MEISISVATILNALGFGLSCLLTIAIVSIAFASRSFDNTNKPLEAYCKLFMCLTIVVTLVAVVICGWMSSYF